MFDSAVRTFKILVIGKTDTCVNPDVVGRRSKRGCVLAINAVLAGHCSCQIAYRRYKGTSLCRARCTFIKDQARGKFGQCVAGLVPGTNKAGSQRRTCSCLSNICCSSGCLFIKKRSRRRTGRWTTDSSPVDDEVVSGCLRCGQVDADRTNSASRLPVDRNRDKPNVITIIRRLVKRYAPCSVPSCVVRIFPVEVAIPCRGAVFSNSQASLRPLYSVNV